MDLREELKQLCKNAKQDAKKNYKKVKLHPLTHLISIIIFTIALVLLVAIPHLQVSEIHNATEKAHQENQDRTTLAQIFGGIAIGIGLYYTWKRITIAEDELKTIQENLKVSQEGQITERFTWAVDQLGAIDQSRNPAIEIRLGGIYALERISTESEKDYWPIMEILTAYVRKNSSIDNRLKENSMTSKVISMVIQTNKNAKKEYSKERNIPLDIQAILTVIGRRKNYLNYGESNHLNLEMAYLQGADLKDAHLEGANLIDVHLEGADLTGTNLEEADLKQAKNLTIDQLSKVKTLYDAKLDEQYLIPLKEKYPTLFEEPEF